MRRSTFMSIVAHKAVLLLGVEEGETGIRENKGVFADMVAGACRRIQQ